METLFFLSLIAFVLISPGLTQKTDKSYCTDIRWNETVIDISALFEEILNPDNNSMRQLANTIVCTRGHEQLMFYYETDFDSNLRAKISFVEDWVETLATQIGYTKAEVLLSLRFNSTKYLKSQYKLPTNFINHMDQLSNVSLINKVAFEFTGNNNGCPSGENTTIYIGDIKNVCKHFAVNICQDFKFGYSVNRPQIGCRSLLGNVKEADFIVLKLRFEPRINFFGSFGVFKRHIDNDFLESKSILSQLIRYERLTYYHLQYVSGKGDTVSQGQMTNGTSIKMEKLSHTQNFERLYDKFIQEWRKTDRSVVIQKALLGFENCQIFNSDVRSLLMPQVPRFWNVLEDKTVQECNFLSSVQLAINDLRQQRFDNVVIHIDLLEYIDKIVNTVPIGCKTVMTLNTSSDMLNGIVVFPHDSEYVEYIQEFLSDVKFVKMFKTLFGVSLGKYVCEIYLELITYPDISALDISSCDNIVLHFPLYLNLVEYPKYRDSVVTNIKEQYFLWENIIHSIWPNKTIIIMLNGEEWVPELESSASLYCNPIGATLSEYYEAIFNWVETLNVPVILDYYDQLYTYKNPLFWYRLEIDEKIFPDLQYQFQFYLRRSFNISTVIGTWVEGMHSCVSWLREVPTSGINFLESYIGTYMHMNLLTDQTRNMTEMEVFTLLLFTMTNFQMIEVEIRNKNEMNIVFDALTSSNFKQSIIYNSIKKREIFLNLRVAELQIANTELQPLKARLQNISSFFNQDIVLKAHLSKHSTVWETLAPVFKESSLDIGLELGNCVEIVKTLGNITVDKNGNEMASINENLQLDYLEKVSYLICTIPAKQEVTNNELAMQKYFETHIYMKKILQVFFPNLKNVYFKMLPNNMTSSAKMKDFLILLGHMNEFSQSYKISYFLLPAFQPEHITNNEHYVWWEISNYTDLSDARMFQDIQSKYLGKDSQRPVLLRTENIVDNKEPTPTPEKVEPETFWLIFGLITAILLLIAITVLTVVAVKARRNALLLSDEEVQEFIKGRQETLNMLGNFADYNYQHVCTEYNTQYEISKTVISLEFSNILGMGNFGIVYKASINSCVTKLHSVAVKMPLEGCNKQAFIGMLREVKLIGYLGNHQNVVEFIGCYTKEIQRGILYVVMELCTGGSLLSHLRNVKSSKDKIMPDAIFPDLIRFCRDVAYGMEYIAGKNVIHGDLSARNVLLDGLKVCKISDFGLSRKLYEYCTYTKKTQEPLPWRWMSYESLVNMEFSTMSDVWSFGITAWEIFSLGEVPYPGLGWSSEFAKQLEHGMRLTMPAYATSEIHKKIEACWKLVPDERPHFTELGGFFIDRLPYTEIE